MIFALLIAPEFTLISANSSTDDFWVAKTPIPISSYESDSAVLNGKVYVIGTNFTGTAGTNSNYMYDPATNNWTEKTPMPYFQSDFGLTTYEGQIYVIGGYFNNLPKATATIQVYNPATDSWSNSTELPFAEGSLRAATVNGKIYVMGRAITGLAVPLPIGITEVYDPNNNTWNILSKMPVPVIGFAMIGIGDKIYVLGGYNGPDTYTNQTQIYDTQTNTWSFGSSMPVTTSYSVATATTGVFAPPKIINKTGVRL